MGDFNINILNTKTCEPISTFINDMFSKSVFALINKPTTKFSATLIDNIYTNNVTDKHKFKQSILNTDITDHLPVTEY